MKNKKHRETPNDQTKTFRKTQNRKNNNGKKTPSASGHSPLQRGRKNYNSDFSTDYKLSTTDYSDGIFSIGGKDMAYVRARGASKETSIEVKQKNWNTALHGDSVRVKDKKIVEILVRSKAGFAGELKQENGNYFISPADPKMYTDILISKDELLGANVGEKVFAVITEWKDPQKAPLGKIVEVLGKTGENNAEMQAIALERGFSSNFPKEVEDEANELHKNAENDFKNEIKNRRDFRGVTTFTIDPFDAKDFDDALSFKKLDNDTFEIGIHIADVSHFVRPQSALDKEALARSTSVYLVDRTIPMLPEVLSNDLCSLKPDVDRLTMSTVVTVNKNAEVINTWFGKTIIHSDKRFSYEEAQIILDEGHGIFHDELLTLNTLAKKLTTKRFADGAISLDQEEVKFVLDEHGVPQTVYRKLRQDTNKLIEEFMLLANRLVAEHIGKIPHPKKGESAENPANKEKIFLYRIHDNPDQQKTEDLNFFLKKLGYNVHMKNGRIPSYEINRLVEELEGKPEKDTVQTAIVRSMMKAIYSTKNIGHYGLAFEYYTHFTSPIRRYPDIIAHRLLDTYSKGEEIPRDKWYEYDLIAEASSMREKEAADAERASIKYKQVEYMSARIGEIYDGIVTGVVDFGIFVEEKETKCEGVIRTRDLGTERFAYDEKHMTLTGNKTGKQFHVGDRLKIKVVKADINKRTIDYVLVRE